MSTSTKEHAESSQEKGRLQNMLDDGGSLVYTLISLLLIALFGLVMYYVVGSKTPAQPPTLENIHAHPIMVDINTATYGYMTSTGDDSETVKGDIKTLISGNFLQSNSSSTITELTGCNNLGAISFIRTDSTLNLSIDKNNCLSDDRVTYSDDSLSVTIRDL